MHQYQLFQPFIQMHLILQYISLSISRIIFSRLFCSIIYTLTRLMTLFHLPETNFARALVHMYVVNMHGQFPVFHLSTLLFFLALCVHSILRKSPFFSAFYQHILTKTRFPFCIFQIIAYYAQRSTMAATYCHRCHYYGHHQCDVDSSNFDCFDCIRRDGSCCENCIREMGLVVRPLRPLMMHADVPSNDLQIRVTTTRNIDEGERERE